jgi:hypothetical protein
LLQQSSEHAHRMLQQWSSPNRTPPHKPKQERASFAYTSIIPAGIWFPRTALVPFLHRHSIQVSTSTTTRPYRETKNNQDRETVLLFSFLVKRASHFHAKEDKSRALDVIQQWSSQGKKFLKLSINATQYPILNI